MKVKPFGKIRQLIASNSSQPQRGGKRDGKCTRPEGGKPISKPRCCLKKKRISPHARDQKAEAATNAPTNPFRSLPGFSDRLPLFSSVPATAPLPATATRERGPWTAGAAVPHAARGRAATHPSRWALATAAAAGWRRAGIGGDRRAPAADMCLEPALP